MTDKFFIAWVFLGIKKDFAHTEVLMQVNSIHFFYNMMTLN